jgi:dTDP-3-amino-3,4,6-trideoxy-alpha-D-glucose transaminase
MRKVVFLDLRAANAELAIELEQALLRVLHSGQYLRGSEAELFEQEFAQYCGRRAAVGVGNGLAALQLTLEAIGIGHGDEVLVSAHTSIATWLAISHAGAKPLPIEPDERTMVMDPSCVEASIGARTAAILPVHLYGMPVDMDALAVIARKHGLVLVEDASQAHGARLRGHTLGAQSDAAAYSLYPTKNLGALGDAGIVVSDDSALVERVRVLANYGERRRHQNEVRGHNSRLDEIQAALLRTKLQRLDDWNERRRSRAKQYLELLADCPGLELPGVTADALPVWHQFVVRVAARDDVRDQLALRGIETLVHYPTPPHKSGAYAHDYHDPLPLTERFADSVMSLPISPQLTETDCTDVSEALLATVRTSPGNLFRAGIRHSEARAGRRAGPGSSSW